MKKILILLIVITFITSTKSYANDEQILKEQEEKYGISDFLNKSAEYLEEIDLNDFFKTSLTGKFDNNKLLKLISKLFNKNIKNALLTLSGIIIVVVIGSILKAISENLGNETISKISYYMQYILIVTLIMTNFSNAIIEVKNAINELSTFSKLLIPLLTTLMIASREYYIIWNVRTNIAFNHNICRKFYNKCSNTNNFNINSTKHNF